MHEFNEELSEIMKQRFTTDRDGNPSTWGEALQFKINKQNSNYRILYPQGSPSIKVRE